MNQAEAAAVNVTRGPWPERIADFGKKLFKECPGWVGTGLLALFISVVVAIICELIFGDYFYKKPIYAYAICDLNSSSEGGVLFTMRRGERFLVQDRMGGYVFLENTTGRLNASIPYQERYFVYRMSGSKANELNVDFGDADLPRTCSEHPVQHSICYAKPQFGDEIIRWETAKGNAVQDSAPIKVEVRRLRGVVDYVDGSNGSCERDVSADERTRNEIQEAVYNYYEAATVLPEEIRSRSDLFVSLRLRVVWNNIDCQPIGPSKMTDIEKWVCRAIQRSGAAIALEARKLPSGMQRPTRFDLDLQLRRDQNGPNSAG